MKLASSTERDFFSNFTKHIEIHNKSVVEQRVTSEISSFPPIRVSRYTGCSCHAYMFVSGGKCTTKRETEKKGKERRRSTFVAGSMKSFGAACFVLSPYIGH